MAIGQMGGAIGQTGGAIGQTGGIIGQTGGAIGQTGGAMPFRSRKNPKYVSIIILLQWQCMTNFQQIILHRRCTRAGLIISEKQFTCNQPPEGPNTCKFTVTH